MKFGITCAVSISLLSSFFCHASELSQTFPIFLDEEMENQTLPIFLDEEIEQQKVSQNYNYFFSPNNTTPKLRLSTLVRSSFEKYINYQNIRSELTKDNIEQRRRNLEEKDASLQTVITYEQQLVQEQTIILQAQLNQDKLEKANQTPQEKKVIKKPRTNSRKTQNTREQFSRVRDSLMFQYNAANDKELVRILEKKCQDLFTGKDKNIPLLGAYLDTKRSILIGEINREWIFFFCYCTKVLYLKKNAYPYPDDKIDTLAQDIMCKTPDCQRLKMESLDGDQQNNIIIVSKEALDLL